MHLSLVVFKWSDVVDHVAVCTPLVTLIKGMMIKMHGHCRSFKTPLKCLLWSTQLYVKINHWTCCAILLQACVNLDGAGISGTNPHHLYLPADLLSHAVPYEYSERQVVCFLLSVFSPYLSLVVFPSNGHFSTYTRTCICRSTLAAQRHETRTKAHTHTHFTHSHTIVVGKAPIHEYSSTPASGKKVF